MCLIIGSHGAFSNVSFCPSGQKRRAQFSASLTTGDTEETGEAEYKLLFGRLNGSSFRQLQSRGVQIPFACSQVPERDYDQVVLPPIDTKVVSILITDRPDLNLLGFRIQE